MRRPADTPGRMLRLPHGDGMLHWLLGALMLAIFVTEPISALGFIPRWLQGIFLTVISAIGFLGLSNPTQLARPLIASSLLLIIAQVVVIADPATWIRFVAAGVSMACLIVLALALLREVFAAGSITFARIEGAIAVYLLMAVCFAVAYSMVQTLRPEAFNGVGTEAGDGFGSHFLYFSLVTQTSTGFGDITPVHPVARALATLQAVSGQIFIAVLLARLVSLEIAGREKQRDD